MSKYRYLLVLMRAILVLCWASTAAAAGLVAFTAHSQPLEIDPVLAVLACFTSTLAAVTTLAIRVNNLMMQEQPQPLVRPLLFCGAHMGGAWIAGLAGFFVSRVNQWDPWNSLLIILVGSFMGAKFIEMIAEKYMPVVRPPKKDDKNEE